jgi:heme-degrading monooxygenase HmoA
LRTDLQAAARWTAIIPVVIARLWHGWTLDADADEYERMLIAEILPGIGRISGYRGAYLLRRAAGSEVEFATITLWDSLDAVREFAGEDWTRAVIAQGAGPLLTRFDERSTHYDTILEPAASAA